MSDSDHVNAHWRLFRFNATYKNRKTSFLSFLGYYYHTVIIQNCSLCFLQVLQSFKIMDYSLLVAIHKVEEAGHPRMKRSYSEPSSDNPMKPDSPSDVISDSTRTSTNGQHLIVASTPGRFPKTPTL